MKRLLLFILLSTIFFSCSINKLNHRLQKGEINSKLIGIWTEHWGVDSIDPSTDVTYVDTIKMELNQNGKLKFWCINNSNYLYDSIKFDGIDLKFRMENIVDSNEKFYVYYFLKLNNQDNLLSGKIINSRKQTVSIELQKFIKSK